MQYDKYLFISMIIKNRHKNKKNIFLIIIFLLIMHLSGSFYNLYVISKFNITERLIKSYNYCGLASYGFINNIYKNFNINENINTGTLTKVLSQLGAKALIDSINNLKSGQITQERTILKDLLN